MKLTKRHSIFILLAMLFTLSAFAQTSFDKTSFLKAHSDYFYAVQVENSQLALYAYADKYSQLSEDDKKPLIHSAIQQSGLTSVLVYCKYNRELWMHRSDGAIVLVDAWNLNDMEVSKYAPPVFTGSLYHPFFMSMNFGLLAQKENFTMSGGARVGCYLLKQMFDIAAFANFSANSGSTITEIGFSGRAYYTFRFESVKGGNIGIRPFVGLGFSRNSNEVTTYGTTVVGGYEHQTSKTEKVKTNSAQFSFGVCRFFKQGSLDLCFQKTKDVKPIISVGFTFTPSIQR